MKHTYINMMDISVILLLFMTSYVIPYVTASDDLDALIHDVAVSDDHYYNDVRQEVIPARAILGEEVVNVTFNVGRGYRGKIIDEEKEIFTERLNSLRDSGVSLSQEDDGGRTCLISVSGEQLARNYIRFYRARKEVEDGQPSFVKLRLVSGKTKVLVPLLQTVQLSKESLFKYLPYQLNHLVDLFSFTVSYDIQSTHFINYEVTVSKGCLPEDATRYMLPEESNAINGSGKNTDAVRLPKKSAILTETAKSGKKVNLGASGAINRTHGCHPDVLDDHDVMPCYDVIKDVSGRRRHLFMLIIQMQNLFMKRFHGDKADDTEVCAVQLAGGAASGTGTQPQHTLVECCHVIIGRQKLFRKGEEEHGWSCHEPYSLSGVILSAVEYMAYIAWIMLPLAIASLPADLHRAGDGRQDDTTTSELGNQTQLSRKPSMNSESRALQRLHSPTSWTPVSMTPDSLSLDEPEDQHPDAPPPPALADDPGTTQTLLPYPHQHGSKKTMDPWTDRYAVPSQKFPPCGLVFVNDDPVYHFGIGTLVYYGLLFHVDSHHLVVARRFLFLFAVWLLQQLGALQLYIYYPFLYSNIWVARWPSSIWFGVYPPEEALGNENQYHIALVVHLVVIPLALAVLQFIALSPLLSSKGSIAETLYWDEHQTDLGNYVGIDEEDNVYDFNLSFEDRIQRNLYARLLCVSKVEFWMYLFRYAIFKVKYGKSGVIIYAVKALVKVIIIPMVFPLYILPIFTFFHVFYSHHSQTEAATDMKQSLSRFGTQVMIALGIVGLFFMFLPSLFFYICLLIFTIVDVIRNISDTLTQAIFLMSILANIKSTFSGLEDEYRTVKSTLFNVVEQLNESDTEQDRTMSSSLLWRGEQGELAIPRPLFDHVCHLNLPLSGQVSGALRGLVSNLFFFGLLYTIIVEYQIFDQFSQTGESIITVVFVSLPSLLGAEKTDAQNELDTRERCLKMKATLHTVLASTDFWAEMQPRRRRQSTFTDEPEAYVTSV